MLVRRIVGQRLAGGGEDAVDHGAGAGDGHGGVVAGVEGEDRRVDEIGGDEAGGRGDGADGRGRGEAARVAGEQIPRAAAAVGVAGGVQAVVVDVPLGDGAVDHRHDGVDRRGDPPSPEGACGT